MDAISQNMNYIIVALVVLAGLILVTVVFRSIGGKVKGRRGSRLGISEYFEIDNDRQLLLIRRDDREHLIMIGGSEDLVIESGIEVETAAEHEQRLRRMPPRREAYVRDSDDDSGPIPLRPAPRPAVFGDRSPALRPVGRDEPKLGAVPAAEEEK